jgi:transglutaminase-like putative cysteine protease/predicted esterase
MIRRKLSKELFLAIAWLLSTFITTPGLNAHDPPDPWAAFQVEASGRFGEAGAQAAAFLAAHHPTRDESIDPQLLLENLDYALAARQTFPWAQQLSDELFLNDVLPYAILDETRERWRPVLHKLASEIVKKSSTAADAAQALNRELFKAANVRYSTARQKANQSALESMNSGLASCTGLSILLVNACRSVAIPARIAGIASWVDRQGNHTWVEIWDGERWQFTGAAEYDANGLGRAWFAEPASRAVEGHVLHAVWASSWQRSADHFPLAWKLDDHSVPAVDVTVRYARPAVPDDKSTPMIAVRLWSSRGGTRLAAHARLASDGGAVEANTFADPDDINRVAEFRCQQSQSQRLELSVNEQTRIAWLDSEHNPGRVIELYWDELSLTADSAKSAATKMWEAHVAAHRETRKAELDALLIRDGEHQLRLLRRDFGERPASGHSLWISMHGGGGAPTAVNDQQWANQLKLYQPKEGIYLAPRAPSDTWNLWHRAEVDRLFDRLIESAILAWDIDPDRVYLMGYSAGGDGVFQLAPRMADRFAAASMMAGHPNDASPLGLRNLPFAIFAGANDAAYNRNTVAREWGKQLNALRESDPEGYPHRVEIYPELGHWMNGRDAEAIPWMADMKRNVWPRRVVWHQGSVPHTRFYWLAVSEQDAVAGRTIIAEVRGQDIEIHCEPQCTVELQLCDELLDLDQPIRVVVNDQVAFEGRVMRSIADIAHSLEERADPNGIATARLVVLPRSATGGKAAHIHRRHFGIEARRRRQRHGEC